MNEDSYFYISLFNMNVLFAAHKGVKGLGPLYTPWEEVLETSDVITLHSRY